MYVCVYACIDACMHACICVEGRVRLHVLHLCVCPFQLLSQYNDFHSPVYKYYAIPNTATPYVSFLLFSNSIADVQTCRVRTTLVSALY
jgi:hypothetical protein